MSAYRETFRGVVYPWHCDHCETGVLAATSEVVSVHFDMTTRASLPIPDDRREALRRFVVEKV